MYVPTPTMTNGVVELPVFNELLGSIKIIELASTAPSSVSLLVIKAIVNEVSSRVTFPESLTATGASFTPVTDNVKVLVAVPDPSLTV